MQYAEPHDKPRTYPAKRATDIHKQQGGFALVVIMTVLMIIGAMATGGISLSTKTQTLAGNAIQRSRSFQAADGANYIAEDKIRQLMVQRVVADDIASEGIFSFDKREAQWWRSDTPVGAHDTNMDTILGVVSQPRYSIEQVGNYVSDGDTGVINLDIGSGSYGRETASGREFILYTVESHGKGSFETIDTVLETTVAITY